MDSPTGRPYEYGSPVQGGVREVRAAGAGAP